MAKKRKVIFFIFTGFLVFVVAVGLVHTFAIYAIPKGFGFNPHPWYAQMPWLNTLRRIFHLPTANLEVSIAYAFFLACLWPCFDCLVGHIDLPTN